MKIRYYKGLPGSGKSTDCKQWISKDPTNRVRVNKDDLRSLLHNSKYSKGNENQVLCIQDSIIIDSLTRGKSIAIDNTHLVEKHLIRLKQLLKEHNFSDVPIEIINLTNVSPTECIKRDLKRANSVGQNVIWRMYWDHIAEIKPPCDPLDCIEKDNAIIVDIDGTLAQMEGRSPFDQTKVSTDSVREHIKLLANTYSKQGFSVIILTGREGTEQCFTDTMNWLTDNLIDYELLLSRKEGDHRKDYIVKRELYEEYIEPFFNVLLVVDDRPQVIREWRRLGLPVINANPIDREF